MVHIEEDGQISYDSEISLRNRISAKMASQIIDSFKISSPPIVLRDIIKHLHEVAGYKFFVKKIDLKDTYSGQIVISGANVGILYNQNHSQVRQRFTVAHELGHLILSDGQKMGVMEEIVDLKTKSRAEVEANNFAAELLMPSKLLRKVIKNGSINSIEELAKRFDVSTDAMWYQITKCNLLKLIR